MELSSTPGEYPWKGLVYVLALIGYSYLTRLQGNFAFAAVVGLVAVVGSIGLATQVLRSCLLCGVKVGE